MKFRFYSYLIAFIAAKKIEIVFLSNEYRINDTQVERYVFAGNMMFQLFLAAHISLTTESA